jgi:general secretion pathway protein I
MKRPTQTSGFTMLEALVALAILALALGAGIQASVALTRQAERHTEQWLAQLCVENALAELRLLRQLPDTGDTVLTCEQMGRTFAVRQEMRPTPNPNFRRVDASASRSGGDSAPRLLSFATIVGRF